MLAASFALAVLPTLSACSSEQEAGEAKTYPPPDPLLYEIANAEGGVEGWMLGTIHALPDGVSWRTDEVERAANEADVLIVEVASLGQGGTVREAFLELSRSPGLPEISERVGPDLRPKLEEMVTRSKISRAHLRGAEDWAAAIMLARVDAPGNPDNGVDKALIAEFEDREIVGLETAREQLGIFDTLAADDQRALLEGTVREWSASRSNPDRLIGAWLTGDIAVLEEVTTTGIMADPELRAALLTNRNDDWTGPIERALEEEPLPLIAVGAAHLIGPQGLAAQLEERGYTVTRAR